jgi:hypothetical protein
MKSFNIKELLHCKSKCHGTKPMHPSSSRAFQRHQSRTQYEASWFSGISYLQNKTKQNKLPSFIDKYVIFSDDLMDVPSSNHDFMVDLCSMKVQIFMQKFCPSSSMELHLLENPRIIFLWMNIHGTRMILIQKEK